MPASNLIYAKFDLTEGVLEQFTELKDLAKREGAVRTSLIIRVGQAGAASTAENLGISPYFGDPQLSYVALKAPALEGTEIWIVAAAHQADFEKSIGWEKPSTPLLTFKAEKLRPRNENQPLIERDSLVILGDHGT